MNALARAATLMTSFADRTGLSSGRAPRRYLWTDAFAVACLLGLARATGDDRHRTLALDLIAQVHDELGRHRRDDPRHGAWLSGLSEDDGRAHPTRGGLRIGKPLPERALRQSYDADLEWERDGQYFHYLTKWTHALDQTARMLDEPTFHVWARELAVTAHAAFTYGPPAARRMNWKLSVDLSRPLIPSMGQHDPLDGLVTALVLEATASALGAPSIPSLEPAIADFSGMIDPEDLATLDPLGLGGLLFDAVRLLQVAPTHELATPILAAAATGLRRFVEEPDLGAPADRRLAFRELGLAIGLAGIRLLPPRRLAALAELAEYEPLEREITAFWLIPEHQQSPSWNAHRDINEVMLATSLVPDALVLLATPRPHPPGMRLAG